MAFPSIEMFPSAYKATKLYSQLPTDGIGDFTFARSTTATRTNPNKLIETVAIDIPRLDYLDDICPVFLMEPQRTNLALRSEEFDVSPWSIVGARSVVTANTNTSPDGNVTGDNMKVIIGSVENRIFQTVATVSGATITMTVYLKRGNNDWIHFINFDGANGTRQWFNINTVSVGGTTTFGAGWSTSNATIKDVGNGWRKLTQTVIRTGTSITSGISISDADIDTNGTIDRTTIVWGAQLESSSFPTSYIKTTNLTLTRTIDTATGSGDTNTFNSEEGILYLYMAALSAGATFRTVSITDGTTSNVIFIRYDDTANQVTALLILGGVTQASISFALTDATDFNKFAFKWKVNDFAFWVNGVEVGTDVSGSIFATDTLTQLRFDGGAGAQDYFGKIKELQVYKTALTDSELQTLTTL